MCVSVSEGATPGDKTDKCDAHEENGDDGDDADDEEEDEVKSQVSDTDEVNGVTSPTRSISPGSPPHLVAMDTTTQSSDDALRHKIPKPRPVSPKSGSCNSTPPPPLMESHKPSPRPPATPPAAAPPACEPDEPPFEDAFRKLTERYCSDNLMKTRPFSSLGKSERLSKSKSSYLEDIFKPKQFVPKANNSHSELASQKAVAPYSVPLSSSVSAPKSCSPVSKGHYMPTKSTSPRGERQSPHNCYLDPFDSDQPLDLSVKPRSHSSSKGSEQPRKRSKTHTAGSSGEKHSSSVSATSSSLASLEKKFGGNSYLLEGVSPKVSAKNPIYSAFGGSLFSSALYNTPPLTIAEQSFKNRAFWPRMTQHNHTSTSSTNSTTAAKPTVVGCTTAVPKVLAPEPKFSTQTIMSPTKEPSNPGTALITNGAKYTHLTCSCKKQFETLYDLTIHMQQTGHTPTPVKNAESGEFPKLVRGQDMWLNQGTEQTRQILRCMQCGESFKSLPELTIHMMKTKHYTNIVGTDTGKKAHKCSAYCEKCPADGDSVFKCKVCHDTYNDMDGLTSHMVLSGHHKHQVSTKSSESVHKNHITKSPKSDEKKSHKHHNSTSSPVAKSILNGKQESCKNSFLNSRKMPVHNDIDEDEDDDDDLDEDKSEISKIRCENCGERIDTQVFVEHVRACVKAQLKESPPHSRPSSSSDIKPKIEEDRRSSQSDGSQNYPPSPKNSEKCESRTSSRSSEAGDSTAPRSREFDMLERLYRPASQGSDSSENITRCRSRENNVDANSGSSEEGDSATLDRKDILHSTTPELNEGSALKAMESFIERSFISGLSKPNYLGGSRTTINGRFTTLFDRPEFSLPDSTGMDRISLHQKYLNPDLPLPATIKAEKLSDDNSQSPVKEMRPTAVPIKSECSTPESTCKTEPLDNHEDSNATPERNCEHESPKSLHEKYLTEDNDDEVKDKRSSALESLQGLVYGKSLTSEHPLDSLQKLIHTADSPGSLVKPNGTQSVIAGTATLQPGSMPSTVILVNPIVTVVPSTSSPASLHINISTHDSTITTQCSPTSSTTAPSSAGSNKGSGSENEADQLGDFRCQACNRTFASKGSYRYHLSRCHLSSVKKYGIKEAFNMSPYVYLPLDHSAKFHKYYEMANELANKGKLDVPPALSPSPEVADKAK